jgi:DNA-binding PadR family transcriptional regulator
MGRSRKLSPQSLTVLSMLANRQADWLYGLELASLTGLKSGTLYPILIRLADRTLLESRWLEPREPGRPARHAYRITGAGLSALAEANSALKAAVKEAFA